MGCKCAWLLVSSSVADKKLHRPPPLRAHSRPGDLFDVLTDRETPLSRLQELLDDAIDNEDYDSAAQLRDELQKRRVDSRLAVQEVNETFYRAFQAANAQAMADVWGYGEHVQCIHPLAGCIAGRQAVLESWSLILRGHRVKIQLEDVRIFTTDETALVTCTEIVDGGDSKGRIVATNVFEKQKGKWKLLHHHGSPAPPPM